MFYQDQTGDMTGANLASLTPFTNYSIAVAAVNREGQVVGLYSQNVTIQTHEHSELQS